MGTLTDLGDHGTRRGQHRLYRLAVAVRAVGSQREPERQATRPPGEVHGEVGRIPLRTVHRLEIAGELRVGVGPVFGLAVKQGTAVEGGEQPLVGVHDERVGMLDADEPVSHRWGSEGRSAVGAIHVQPDPVLPADR